MSRSTSRGPRIDDLQEGARRAALIVQARRLLESMVPWREIGARLGVDHATLHKWVTRAVSLADAELTAEACAPRTWNSGRRPVQSLSPQAIEVARAYRLRNNLSWSAGSTPIALQEAIRRGEMPAADAELIAARMAEGKSPLPRSQARLLRISETTTRAHRSPRNAWLDYASSEGSLMLTIDAASGQERYVRPGEWLTLDDGSLNLACTVADLERPGDPCWERYGVCLGRFQFLLFVDHRSYFIPGFSFTARPRDSYRAEDLTAAMQVVFSQHGVPAAMVLEHGVSAANLVTRTLQLAGCEILRASSPHQKVVEIVFNHLWTRLSYLPGQVGRYRGEEEATGKIIQACRSGARDPREVFAPLPDVLRHLREVVGQWNAHRVHSDRYGDWVPEEWWNREAYDQLRRISPQDAWMFAPVATDPLTVRGARVETSVPLIPGYSTKFVFGADWLAEFHGCKVRLHFNPLAPDCEAAVVLAQAVGDHREGAVLGHAVQFDRLARRTRRILGYGADPDIGAEVALAHSRGLRREVQAVLSGGRMGTRVAEVRGADGSARTMVVEGASTEATDAVATEPAAAAPPVARRSTAVAVPTEAPEPAPVPFSRRRQEEFEEV